MGVPLGIYNSYLSGMDAVAPKAGDRDALNKAFTTLKGELKTKKTEQGIALFAKGRERGALLSDVEFDAVLNRVTAGLKDADRVAQFVKVPSFESLPSAILKEAEKQGNNGGISGVFHRGKIYLIRDAIANEKRLGMTEMSIQDTPPFNEPARSSACGLRY